MYIMKKILLLTVMASLSIVLFAQTDTTKKEVAKKGWGFGAVPAIAYDSDIGFKYGGLVNFYDYGDGTIYPNYKHSIYMEWSHTTKGSGIAEISYDSKYLIPGVRFTGDIDYLTEQALDFYGFNGYNSYFNSDYSDNTKTDYKSRMYYRLQRSLLRMTGDFQGKLAGNKLMWVAGIHFYGVNISDVNRDKYYTDLPKVDTASSLFSKYKYYKLIPDNQYNGGNVGLVKFGLVYDTRDNEPNPMTGMWTEVFLQVAPSFMGSPNTYTQLVIAHRQYFTLKKEVLNFAYRVAYQTKLSGDIPFYMLPLVYYSNRPTTDGIGGAKTVRGIMRDRIVGDGMAYANLEMRWKFYRHVFGKQNFYIALAGFLDGGMVTQNYKFDLSHNPPPDLLKTIDYANETPHICYGAGLHFVLNQNFIVTVDYGQTTNPQDGGSGLYINLNFLF